MKLIFGLSVLLAALIANQITVSIATSEPVCGYKNSEGEMIFMKYLPYSGKGEQYVDFKDGKCLSRATCTDTYKTKVEDCKSFPVTCQNKKSFEGVFPACCVKC